MIARLLFPPLTSYLPNPPQVLVPHQGRGSTVPMLPDTGILSRWNCYPPDPSGSAVLIYLPFGRPSPPILRCSGSEGLPHRGWPHSAPRLGSPGSHCPRLGFLQVRLALTHLPFPLSKDFQPGAVQYQMQGPSSFPEQGNRRGTLAEGGIVRHRPQVKQGPEKPFGSQGQVKDTAHHQQALDCSIGIEAAHRAFGGRRASRLQYPLRWSIGLSSPVDQAFIVVMPVTYPILGFPGGSASLGTSFGGLRCSFHASSLAPPPIHSTMPTVLEESFPTNRGFTASAWYAAGA